MRLPRSTDELRGLRAARWIRESTERQADRYGPDAQREQQDRAIERYGLVDAGIAWQVHHSGRTVASTSQWSEMMAAAGRDYDVLVVGYVSRFARDLRTAVNARHDLHAAGATILFADERLLSSDEEQWEVWAREAVEAEAYQRRLGRRIREGYAAKFRRHADPGGNPPLGFKRVNGLLVVDVDECQIVVEVFRRYAEGNVSLRSIEGETGISADALRDMLRNPIYNGWSSRHGDRAAAAWRSDPPIDDELWMRVQLVRERRVTGGGGARAVHGHLLGKILWCVCGTRVKADGARRYRHSRPCPEWSQGSYVRPVYETPIRAQIATAKLSHSQVENIRRLAGQPVAPPTGELRKRQLERELTDRAADHARRRITTEHYLADHRRITAEIDAIAERLPAAPLVDADTAVAHVQNLRRTWELASEAARARLIRSIYQRVTVRAGEIVEVELTPDAWRHGMALALPERVALARPAGFEPGQATWMVPIAGRKELLRTLRRIA